MQQPEIAQQLTAAGVPVFPCWDNKQPALAGGHHSASITPADYWPSVYVGVPVPDLTIILDVDTYKGMTLTAIDEALGCELDWVNALIQTTPNGGEHYAFRVSQLMHQRIDWFKDAIGKGFDTRTFPSGYICTGEAYTAADAIGVMRLLSPDCFPLLPDAAVELLKTPDIVYTPLPLPEGDKKTSEVQHLLTYLDADCGRDDWMTVLRAIRHHYHDDEAAGWALFNNWSMTAEGAVNDKGEPVYSEIEAAKQWTDTSPTPKNGKKPVTLSSLAAMAIDKGYVPSSLAAELFGSAEDTPSAPLVDIETLIVTINAMGGKPEKLDELTTAIRTIACNSIQRAALTATLQRTLKTHGIKITEKELRQATSPQLLTPLVIPQPVAEIVHFYDLDITPIPSLGSVHRLNARMLQQSVFGDRLAMFDAVLRWWDGRHWGHVNEHDLSRKVSAAFEGSEFGKSAVINGTREQLMNVVPVHRSVNPVSQFIFFNNGVLDLRRPDLGIQQHSRDNFNTYTLTADYEPGTPHPQWDGFLDSVFPVEKERKLLLQEIFGWALITDNMNHQKAAILDGKSRSGKGVCLEVLNGILGQAMIATPLDELHDPKHLSNMRTAIVGSDTDAKGPHVNDIRKVHSVFNKLTANEPISLKLLWQQEPWVGRVNCKMIMASNGIPVISDDAGAAPNRWLILKFTESFLGEEDRGFVARLLTEKSAITAWAVEGLRRLMINDQFTIPESSRQETALLVESSSPISQFIDDRVEIAKGEACHIVSLYEAYRGWCMDAGERPAKRSNFRKSMMSVLPSQDVKYTDKIRINDKQNTGIIGIKLAPCVHGVSAPNVTPIGQKLKDAPAL